LSLSCGVDVILGLNGYCWVSKHVSPITTESDAYEIYSNENVAITDLERETIARVGNCIKALALHSVFLNDSNINYAFELSLNYSPKAILQLDIAQLVAQGTLARMQS
jgi:exosome complex component RRP4